MNVKQVIVIRKDLNMRKGKMIAQGVHACINIFLDMNLSEEELFVPLNHEMREWVHDNLSRVIVVSVNSEKELLDVYQKAQNTNLPCSLIKDFGLTEFHDVHTLTAVAIGPAEEGKIDQITGKLPLL